MVDYEDPFTCMDLDIIRASPDMVAEGLIKVTNAIVKELQRNNANQSHITGMSRTDPLYNNLNKERHDIDNRLDALKKKYDTLEHVAYMKSSEMRMTAKSYH